MHMHIFKHAYVYMCAYVLDTCLCIYVFSMCLSVQMVFKGKGLKKNSFYTQTVPQCKKLKVFVLWIKKLPFF